MNYYWLTIRKKAFERIMKIIEEEEGGLIFLDAPGGSGKTFLLNLIFNLRF